MDSTAYRVVSLQVLVALILSALAYLAWGPDVAKSALFGGTVAYVNGFVSLWRTRQAERVAAYAPGRARALIYGGALIRFLITLILFGFAFGYWKLGVIPALAVFAVAQMAYGWGLKKSYKDLL